MWSPAWYIVHCPSYKTSHVTSSAFSKGTVFVCLFPFSIIYIILIYISSLPFVFWDEQNFKTMTRFIFFQMVAKEQRELGNKIIDKLL